MDQCNENFLYVFVSVVFCAGFIHAGFEQEKQQRILNHQLANAVSSDNYENAEKLVKMGADPNTRYDGISGLNFAQLVNEDFSNRGMTGFPVLHMAKSPQMIHFLVSKGARVNSKDSAGYALLHKTDNTKIQESLLSLGADPNITDFWGMTPLHYSKNPETVSLLLKAGANPKLQDADGETPLHLVSGAQSAELLLQAGANVNAVDFGGYTPLHFVKDSNQAKVLLAHGADPFIKSAFGFSAYDLASSNELKQIIDPYRYEQEEFKKQNKHFKPTVPKEENTSYTRQKYASYFVETNELKRISSPPGISPSNKSEEPH